MSDDIVRLPPGPTGTTERLERLDPDAPAVGRWYWVSEPDGEGKWLGCVTHLGSNYARLEGVRGSTRVHLDTFAERCTPEPAAQQVISGEVVSRRMEVDRLMERIRDTTAALAVGASGAALEAGCESTALALSGGGRPAKEYEASLVLAKEKTLPRLFARIKAENEKIEKLLSAELIPLKAQAEGLEPAIKLIKAQIFNVQLYAGLVEQVVQVSDGAAAPMHEPVHLQQRRHYMDEECLAEYQAGGMSFESIEAFDRWVAAPANRDRLLPHPRCIVAFRVRRDPKKYDTANLSGFISFMMRNMGGDPDLTTFLYIRNGERLHRLTTAIDFGEKLFPDMGYSPPASGQSYALMPWKGKVEAVVSEAAYQDHLEREREREREREEAEEAEYQQELAAYPAKLDEYEGQRIAWVAASAEYEARKKPLDEWEARKDAAESAYMEAAPDHTLSGSLPGFGPDDAPPDPGPEPDEPRRPSEPYRAFHHGFRGAGDYEPYNRTSVWYDDIRRHVAEEMAHHNRLVLVLQGLLDRSPALHPHPPWQLWTEEGFRQALVLVYDDSRALVPGPPPDLTAYLARLSASLGPDSVTIGQEACWLLREARKETNRRERRGDHQHSLDYFRPYGNEGPGRVARAARVVGGKHVFEWTRASAMPRWGEAKKDPEDGKYYRHREYPQIRDRIAVPAAHLFNVSAYAPGDFKQFFADPRTRAQYLKWAPLLLTAEEYHAGKIELGGKSRGASDYYNVMALLNSSRNTGEE